MVEVIIITFSIILILVGILGTILPILPGLFLSLCGLFLYKFGTSNELSIAYVWVFSALTLISGILNYIIPAKTNRKYGGTKWGSIGSIAGTIIGFLTPIPFGFLIGMFLGVFVGELMHDFTDKRKALNSVKGALIGFILGTGFNILIGFAMLIVVLLDLLF